MKKDLPCNIDWIEFNKLLINACTRVEDFEKPMDLTIYKSSQLHRQDVLSTVHMSQGVGEKLYLKFERD